MSQPRPLQLSYLRDIGWSHWNPIGILGAGETWVGHPAAGEYDQYLVAVAGGLRRGWSTEQAAAHLVWAEGEHMSMGIGLTTRARAEATVNAIRGYLRALDEDAG